MKDRLKKALKRAASGLMAVLLAVCLVGTPRAKAVVSEGALLGSIFGSLLVSMGYSWAADNMDAPTFGESIYKLTQEFDEAMKDTGNQLIRDLSLAGLTANGAGKLQFGYAWVQAARSFAEWFQGKFFTSNNNTAIVTGNFYTFEYPSIDKTCVANYPSFVTMSRASNWGAGSLIQFQVPIESPNVFKVEQLSTNIDNNSLYVHSVRFVNSGGSSFSGWSNGSDKWQIGTNTLSSTSTFTVTQNMVDSGIYMLVWLMSSSAKQLNPGDVVRICDAVSINYDASSSLTAEKPQEVHYPDVAEDGSQVYEITVDGVTATDIEGIIQGAVDRILAGTAAIAGSIADAQAKPGEITSPEIDPYKVGLSSVFPFCIPFDVYNMVTMFVAEPEAPSAEWTFTLPWSSQEYSVGWDLSAFDGVARVCRDMELVLFAVGLAVITYKVIKW